MIAVAEVCGMCVEEVVCVEEGVLLCRRREEGVLLCCVDVKIESRRRRSYKGSRVVAYFFYLLAQTT